MGTRVRENVQGASFARNDRMEFFLAGYHAAMVSSATPNVDVQEDSTPVYGYDATLDSRIINNGSLSLVSYEHVDRTSALMDVLMGIDPNSTGLRAYRPKGNFVCDVTRHTKHPELDHYIKAELYAAWGTVLMPTQGDPKATPTRTLDGRSAIPVSFNVKDPEKEAIVLVTDVAAMGVSGANAVGSLGTHRGAGALTVIPAGVNPYSGKYALVVEVQKRSLTDNKILKSDRLTITPGMVTEAGLITITPSNLLGSRFESMADVTHAFVVALKHYTVGGGLIPSATPLLLADGINVRGRHDYAPPAAHSGLASSNITQTGVTLTWVQNSSAVTSTLVQQSSDAGVTYTTIATKAAGVLTHAVTGLTGSTAYKFRVIAYNGDEAAVASNVLDVTTAL